MSKITKIEEDIHLLETSLAEELAKIRPSFHPLVVDRLTTFGGCYSTIVTQEAIDASAEASMDGNALTMPTGRYIVLIDDFAKVLTDAERRAVIAHEICHLHEDDLSKITPVNGVVLDMEAELRADRAGVAATSNVDMRNAIVKIINQCHQVKYDYVCSIGGYHAIGMIHAEHMATLDHPIIRARLAALA